MKITEVQKILSDIETAVTREVLPSVSKLKIDGNIDTALYNLARDKTIEYLYNDPDEKLYTLTKELGKSVFKDLATGTEFDHYEGYPYRIEQVMDLGEFYFDIILSDGISGTLLSSIEIADDALGTFSDWKVAILAVRDRVRKDPNPKYKDNSGYLKILPKLRSEYWKNVVYDSDLYDETAQMRLDELPIDSAAFIFALEQGTGGGQWGDVSEGGFPHPSYGSKGIYTVELADRLTEALSSIIDSIFRKAYDEYKNSLDVIFSKYGIQLTDSLSKALEKVTVDELENIASRGARTNINKSIGVIINIGERYYEVVKTKSGKLGLRYSLQRNGRKRL